MTDALRTPEDYELFVYTIAERFPSIQRSTLRFVRQGDAYGYEVWRGEERLYWYDCQPHPTDPTLADHAPASQAHAA